MSLESDRSRLEIEVPGRSAHKHCMADASADRPRRVNEGESFVPVRIYAFFGEQELAVGTAFHYRHKGQCFLATTWHNFTGREPDTYRLKSATTGAIPDRVRIGAPVRIEDDGHRVKMGWKDIFFDLYKDADKRQPTWLIHPRHGEAVDMVILPVGGLEQTALRCANDIWEGKPAPRLRAGMDAFILGYPRGLTGGGRFPIWKRGSIANEPDIEIRELPLTYVDSATREGMSGAPVYASETGSWLPEGETDEGKRQSGLGRRFMGIYSGRVGGDDPFLAQLGLVWKERAIIEIIEGGRYGVSSFELAERK